MARIQKVHDPAETQRTINFIVKEDDCPGMLEFLAGVPYRMEGPFIHALVFQWLTQHAESNSLDAEFVKVVNGPGGVSPTKKAIKLLQPRRPRGRPRETAPTGKRKPINETSGAVPSPSEKFGYPLQTPTLSAPAVPQPADPINQSLSHSENEAEQEQVALLAHFDKMF